MDGASFDDLKAATDRYWEYRDANYSPLYEIFKRHFPKHINGPVSVYDVGGGHGIKSEFLVTEFGNAVAHIIDISEPMLTVGRELIGPHARISWNHDALPDLPNTREKTSVADFVVLNAVWQYLSSEAQRIQALGTVETLMKAGARAILTYPGPPSRTGEQKHITPALFKSELIRFNGSKPRLILKEEFGLPDPLRRKPPEEIVFKGCVLEKPSANH